MFSRSLLQSVRHSQFSNGHACRSFTTFPMNFTAASRRSRFGKKLVRNELDDTEKEVTQDNTQTKKDNINGLNDKSSVLELISKKMDETFEKEINLNPEKKIKSIKSEEPKKKEDQKKKNINKKVEEEKKPVVKSDNKTKKDSKRSNRFPKDTNTNNKLEAPSQYKVKVKNKKKAKVSPSGDRYKLDIPTFLSVANFATILRVRVPELLEKLQDLGFENMSNEYILDGETASLIAEEYGFEVNQDDNLGADLFPSEPTTDASKLKPRSPIVTIMGHVDHGKTTILDYLRKSSIVKGEFGGITQHIGAFVVQTPVSNKKITFLDTPGHAAFLKMRERGANMTDIIILVVAAEDSIKPQTVEAIKHAKNAGVPVIVAVNKCDKEQADPDKVVADLSTQGVDVEDYGGDTPVVKISAKTGMGMKDLEETIVTVADLLELKTEEEKVPVEGWVLESQVKKGLGNVATFLIKKGQLKPGDVIVAGTTFCKAKVMKDENGKRIKFANPSQPVELAGWKSIPEAGDFGIQSKDEAYAKKVIANREKRQRMMEEASQVNEMNSSRLKAVEEAKRDEKIREYQLEGLNIEEIKELEPELFEGEEEKTKLINFIIKADVSGSAEAVKQSIEGLGNDEVQSKVLFEEVGAPTESDISRAKISDAQILAFNVKVPKDILNSASKEGVEIKEFNVIYHLIEEVLKTLTSKLSPIYETKVVSKVTIKQLFEISLKGKESMVIAGSRVIEGTFKRNAVVRVMRKGELFYEGKIKQLKVEKNDVNEVKNGADCGVALEHEPKIIEGDIIEAIERVPIERHL